MKAHSVLRDALVCIIANLHLTRFPCIINFLRLTVLRRNELVPDRSAPRSTSCGPFFARIEFRHKQRGDIATVEQNCNQTSQKP